MGYKIIASDLDETLIPLSRVIPKASLDAIDNCREAGVKFVPCTGRGYRSVQKDLKDIGLYDLPDEYVISYNGGAITENKGMRLLSFTGMPFEDARDLFEASLSYDISVQVYTPTMVWIHRLDAEMERFITGRITFTKFDQDDIDFLRDSQIAKVLFVKADLPYLSKVEHDMGDLARRFSTSFSSGRFLEFNPKGITKGYGLERIAHLLGVDMADTIAIGDSTNDLSMLEAAGLGCGVANMVPEVRAAVDYACERTVDEGAIAEVIDRFVLA